MDITDPSTVKRFFNAEGRIAAFPVKADRKLQLLRHLAGQFEVGERYSESEVNEVLERFYDDYIYLRRSLVEFGLFDRDPATAMYWRTPEPEV